MRQLPPGRPRAACGLRAALPSSPGVRAAGLRAAARGAPAGDVGAACCGESKWECGEGAGGYCATHGTGASLEWEPAQARWDQNSCCLQGQQVTKVFRAAKPNAFSRAICIACRHCADSIFFAEEALTLAVLTVPGLRTPELLLIWVRSVIFFLWHVLCTQTLGCVLPELQPASLAFQS